MKFNRNGHRDDTWFVIALLLTTIFTGAFYFDSERQMDQIALARHRDTQVAVATAAQAPSEGTVQVQDR